ncbi:Acetate kinase [Bienertia sinuspersici]
MNFFHVIKHLYIRKEIRRMFLSPLWNVKHVVVQMGLPVERCTHSLAEIIDSLLWLSPHPDSISLLIYSEVIIKFQFVYKEPADSVGEADSCCCSVPIKCWRHSLTEVKIDNLPCVEGARRLKALFEESQTLERIEGLL